MKMSNKTYDILKFIALKVLPALATLILALGAIWNIPYSEAIAATITAIDTFLGTILGISSKVYAKAVEITHDADIALVEDEIETEETKEGEDSI
jgi:hypothetical protein